MRITGLRTVIVGNPWKNWLFVLVDTDSGITGLGEATSGLSTKPVESLIQEIEPLVIGLDPRNVRMVRDSLAQALYFDTSPALAGIELACWDVLGRTLETAVWQLLGGRVRDSVPAYANGWYTGPRDPDGVAAAARRAVDAGYRALKFDPFGDALGVMTSAELEYSIEIISRVRQEVGAGAELMIEAHDRFDVDTAIRIGRRLGEFDIRWYEAPTLSTSANALAEVARNVPVAVAAGERLTRPSDFIPLYTSGIRVIQPEVLNLGLLATLEVTAAAETHQLPVAPHNAQSPYSTVVNLHLAALTRGHVVQEHFDAFAGDWMQGLFAGEAVLLDGSLRVPEEPGFGVELDLARAEAVPYSRGNFLRLFTQGWEARKGDHGDG